MSWFLLSVSMATFLMVATSSIGHGNTKFLMDNVLVLTVLHGSETSRVLLTCEQVHQDQDVFWKKDGEIQPHLKGHQINVEIWEVNGGNFSCHSSSSGQYLSHTLVLVQVQNGTMDILEGGRYKDALHCWAYNYNGSFHCKWTRTRSRSQAKVLMFKAHRHSEPLPCQLDSSTSEANCLDMSCSYREEQKHVHLSLHIFNAYKLEVYTKAFYLRDIVRPEAVPGLHSVGAKKFQWGYPESWQRPCTFFGLTFQVKLVDGDDSCSTNSFISTAETDASSYVADVDVSDFGFCVRAQDKHTRGLWSHWSSCRASEWLRQRKSLVPD
nr:interleukin-12 subunit beta-like [Nerophis lumbriciformis]